GPEAVVLIQTMLLERVAHFIAPAHGAAVFAGKEPVLAAHAVRLSAKAYVVFTRKRVRAMFQRLAKSGPAMPFALLGWAEIEMGIDIDDADAPTVGCVPQEMAIGRFVAAAQHNRDRAASQHRGDDLCQRGLGL